MLEPIDIAPWSFGSVGLSYVLHCLPGGIPDKAVVFDRLIPLVDSGGVIFGTTILGRGVTHTRVGRALLGVYNRKGIFSNLDDDRDDLVHALAQRFPRYQLDVVGAVARFAGWVE